MTTARPINVAAGRKRAGWPVDEGSRAHERIEAATGLKTSFAEPHSPWQCGSNENANKIMRQYLPKGTNLSVWDDDQLQLIVDELNDRPRLCRKDDTATEHLRRGERRYALH